MPVLFDRDDDYVRSVLDRAKVHGEISLADLEAIVEAGLEAKDHICPDDIGDTIDALAEMGIEIENGLTQEQKDANSSGRCGQGQQGQGSARCPWKPGTAWGVPANARRRPGAS